jgi:D-sedoheptulose 7-phosphate isomerase
MSASSIKNEILASISVKTAILDDDELISQIEVLAEECLDALKRGGKIIFAGNGGSFADSQHLSAEFVSRFMFDRTPLASVALGTNNSAISAIGNDYGFDQVFARELSAIAQPDDVFIPISTSGNSKNILTAVEEAARIGLRTVALTGCRGGQLKAACSCICVPSDSTARIQESHIMIGHIVCRIVEERYFTKVLAHEQ